MLASQFITTEIPPLRAGDTLHRAVMIFLDFYVAHLPIVNEDGTLAGTLPVDLIVDEANKEQLISDFKEDWIFTRVGANTHALTAFETISRHELSAIPIVDDSNQYQGLVTLQNLTNRLAACYSFSRPGGIIVLRLGMRDYNLSEISRIVESENAKILLLYMDTIEEEGTILLTLKLNTLDLERILASFDRFNYTIDFFQPSEKARDELRDRYDLLMKLFDV